MQLSKKNAAWVRTIITRAAIAAAVTVGRGKLLAGTSANSGGAVQQGQNDGGTGDASKNNPAVTISFSGQTALRNFNTTQGITELQPGTSITLHNGTGNTAVTYTAPSASNTFVQLANPDFTSVDVGVNNPSATTQLHSAIRLEWHEQGSVDGFIDLLNDQVGYVPVASGGTGPLSNVAARGPSSSNPTWVNTNKFTAGGTLNGLVLDGGNYADTYNSSVYNLASGANIVNGQNRLQFSVGEYKTEGLAFGGTPSLTASAGSAGYGLGNPALAQGTKVSGLGSVGQRQAFVPTSSANLSTDKVDPQSITSAHYTAGPWNSAGADNIDSTQIAATAVGIAANPGTGLLRLNLGDQRWLETAGRLQNGADFNAVSRTVNTGQRIVPALNAGIDPSWAVGENDGGDSTSSANANTQHSIGTGIRFSGKTSGTESQKTISQSRLGVGTLSLAEIRATTSNAPVAALDLDFNHLTDPLTGGVTDDSKFIRITFDSIVSNDDATRWKSVLISHYNTVKAPNQTALTNYEAAHAGLTDAQAWAALGSFNAANLTDNTTSGIKGDNYGDVAAFISNIKNSGGTAASGLTAASVNNPADNLFINGYLVPGLLNYSRVYDGGAIANNTAIRPPSVSEPNGSPAYQEQQLVKANYNSIFTTDVSAGSNAQTIGSSSTYGALNAGAPAINTAIPITAKDASGNAVANGVVAPKGNYLFGNFRQNGWRDFAAVKESVNAALSLRHIDKTVLNGSGTAASSIYTGDGGVTNDTPVPSLSGSPAWVSTAGTKGDLIVLGDYNSDGRFDGRDVYLLARGASLADSSATDQLTTASGATFADAVRNPNAVLRKNAALDYVDAQLNTPSDQDQQFLRTTASANLTNDPNGLNAFNKRDVNRDGLINLTDAVTSDKFFGQDYHNLDQTLAATSDVHVGQTPVAISLVDTELTDDGVINQADLDVVDQAFTSTGNEMWTGTLVKSGAGSIAVNYTGGTFKVNTAAALQISAGTLNVGGSADPFTDNTGSATNGNHLAIVNNSTSALNITSGSKAVGVISGVGRTNVSAGATLTADSLRQNQLDVNGNVNIRAGGGNVVAVSTLNVPGKLDLKDNKLVVFGGTLGTLAAGHYGGVSGLIQSGRNGGGWNGNGLLTSTSDAASQLTTLAVDTAGDVGKTTFGGVAVSASDVLVLYTYAGDANLSGSVNGDDYFRIDAGFGAHASGYANGDFNYDGKIDADDYFLIDRNYARQGTPFSSTAGISLSGVSAVPEPAGLALIGLAALLPARRRQQRGRSGRRRIG